MNEIEESKVHKIEWKITREFHAATWGTAMCGALLAWFVPRDVLTQTPYLLEFTDFMAALVPTIDRFTHNSDFPEVTRLYFSVMWLLVPIQIYAIWRAWDTEALLRIWQGRRLRVFLGVCFFSSVAWWAIFFTEGDSRLMRSLNYSRFSLGLLAWPISGMTAFSFALTFYWLKFFPQIYFMQSER